MKFNSNKIISNTIKSIEKKQKNQNSVIDKINKLLLRKDILANDSEKIDSIRMLCCFLEGNIKGNQLIKYLKD